MYNLKRDREPANKINKWVIIHTVLLLSFVIVVSVIQLIVEK